MSNVVRVALFFSLVYFALGHVAFGQSVTRTEALRIAESYIQHRWTSSNANRLHGKDANGIEVHTPDRGGGRCFPSEACWQNNAENVGVAYKWGGTDTVGTFDSGIAAGKAAGDVYTREKRRRGDDAVSDDAVGVDCSGFICRCWKLKKRYSTSTFHEICRKLPSPAELQPADIMDQPGGHVVMFVKWVGNDRKRALFYEAAPFSKTLASERDVDELAAAGYRPLRYRDMEGK